MIADGVVGGDDDAQSEREERKEKQREALFFRPERVCARIDDRGDDDVN